MVATNVEAAAQGLLSEYDDAMGWSNASRPKELAFRRGFVEEARRIAREWVDPADDFDPFGEEHTAHRLRLRIQERYCVYGRGDAGPKTYHLGWRPGHAVPAARLRGRHHALVYTVEAWEYVLDIDTFDHLVLPAWLAAVERWAADADPANVVTPPPRPLEIEGAEVVLRSDRSDAPPTSNPMDVPAAPAPPQLRLIRADQIEMRPPDWLLRGMLERDTLALVFGDPGTGKSFLAIDWACRVATGAPGAATQFGPVQCYTSPVRADRVSGGVYGPGRSTMASAWTAPPVRHPGPGHLRRGPTSGTRTGRRGRGAGRAPGLVVLDTLARSFGGGDENSTQDMSRFVSACDAIRQHWGLTVLVVHHTGHADKSRARGAIALKAALDAEYRLTNTGGLVLAATKMKEAEMPPPLALNLATVELPGLVDEYGNPVTSAAIEVLDADTSAILSKVMAKPGQRGKWQEIGLAVARRLAAEGDDGRASIKDWHAECEKAGMRQSTRYHVLANLQTQGSIAVDGESLITT